MKNFFIKLLQNILGALAKKMIKKFQPEIIGITGSVGKSSAKEAVFAVFSAEFGNDVWSSRGNLNTELGLPLTILGFHKTPSAFAWLGVIFLSFWRVIFWTKYPKYLVLEYAADKSGDIKHLVSIAKPQVAIITKIAPVHTENFGSIENIASEKGFLAESVPSGGAVFLNKSDKFSNIIAKKVKAKIIYFRDKELESHKEIAKEVGKYFNIKESVIADSLLNFKLPPGRLSIFNGVNDSVIIDSTYNSSPEAAAKFLEYLGRYKKNARKVAMLGDMRELGAMSEKFHRQITEKIIENADYAILIGPEMQKWTKPILDQKHFPNQSFLTFSDAKAYILPALRKNDIILVKGSQNTLYLERIVELLLKDKSDIKHLCRRGKKWDDIRDSVL